MSVAFKDFRSVARSVGSKIVYAWEWPNVPENKYSVSDRERLNSLSSYFTALTSVTGSAACIATQCYTPAVIIPAALLAIAVGRYTAGITSEKLRSKKNSDVSPK